MKVSTNFRNFTKQFGIEPQNIQPPKFITKNTPKSQQHQTDSSRNLISCSQCTYLTRLIFEIQCEQIGFGREHIYLCPSYYYYYSCCQNANSQKLISQNIFHGKNSHGAAQLMLCRGSGWRILK